MLYDAVFYEILNVFQERYPDNDINILNLMSIYERVMQGAANRAFDGCVTKGCFFDYSQVRLDK